NGAVRRAAVLARPFDEEIAIAEDHLWARAVGAAERIAYVPEAAVAHSHPMGLGPWRARFYAHGLAAEYARRRRGVELPWGGPRDGAARAFAQLVGTLVRQGEVRALAHLPSYALARTVWFARGVDARGGLRAGRVPARRLPPAGRDPPRAGRRRSLRHLRPERGRRAGVRRPRPPGRHPADRALRRPGGRLPAGHRRSSPLAPALR